MPEEDIPQQIASKEAIPKVENAGLALPPDVQNAVTAAERDNKWYLVKELPPIEDDHIRLFRGVVPRAVKTEFQQALPTEDREFCERYIDRLVQDQEVPEGDQEKFMQLHDSFVYAERPKWMADDIEGAMKYAKDGVVYYTDLPKSEAWRYYRENGKLELVAEVPFDIYTNEASICAVGPKAAGIEELNRNLGNYEVLQSSLGEGVTESTSATNFMELFAKVGAMETDPHKVKEVKRQINQVRSGLIPPNALPDRYSSTVAMLLQSEPVVRNPGAPDFTAIDSFTSMFNQLDKVGYAPNTLTLLKKDINAIRKGELQVDTLPTFFQPAIKYLLEKEKKS